MVRHGSEPADLPSSYLVGRKCIKMVEAIYVREELNPSHFVTPHFLYTEGMDLFRLITKPVRIHKDLLTSAFLAP